MIEKEDWISRHKGASEKEWKAFKQYCLNCGFKSGKRNGQEVIFAPACGLKEKDNANSI